MLDTISRIWNNPSDSANSNNNSTHDHSYDWCVLETKKGEPEDVASHHEQYHHSTKQTRVQHWRDQQQRGILFVKNFKAASTTCAGVTLQVANNVARRKQQQQQRNHITNQRTGISSAKGEQEQQEHQQQEHAMMCRHRFEHEFASAKLHGKRVAPSLLWSVVREPWKRDLSYYYFNEVGRQEKKPSSSRIMRFLQKSKSSQFMYLLPQKIRRCILADEDVDTTNLNTTTTTANATMTTANATTTTTTTTTTTENDYHYYSPSYHQGTTLSSMIQKYIIDFYDFIAVADRMDESLVVLKVLFHLEDEDIIVLKSKHSGGYDDGKYQQTCSKIPKAPKNMSSPVLKYIQTNYKIHNADLMLYDAVNRSLDKTIHSLFGNDPQAFQEELSKHRFYQQLANQYCLPQAIFPCSNNGTLQREQSDQNCYWNDAGCGYQCVNDIIMRHKRGEPLPLDP